MVDIILKQQHKNIVKNRMQILLQQYWFSYSEKKWLTILVTTWSVPRGGVAMLVRCNLLDASATATARLNNWLTVALEGTLVGLVAGLLPLVGVLLWGGVGMGDVVVGGDRAAGDKLKSWSPPRMRPLDANCERGLWNFQKKTLSLHTKNRKNWEKACCKALSLTSSRPSDCWVSPLTLKTSAVLRNDVRLRWCTFTSPW